MENQGLIITAGAQQAINLLVKIFIDPGDLIICEYPSFIGAIAAFKSYNANLSPIPIDDDGIDLDALEKELDARASQIKMIYLTPFFHNPAGIIYSEERKQGLHSLLKDRPYILIEDDPYGELYFDEADKPLTTPLKTHDDGSLPYCYIGSFAKILGPGLRLGWLLAPLPIIEKCLLAKQSLDACSSTFTQVLADGYLRTGKLSPYLSYVRPIYARRAEIMLEALSSTMPAGVSWTTPKGGFYIWVTLPSHIDASEVLNRSITQGAAFVIGSAFDPHGVKNNSMRLAFSYPPEDQIEKGIGIIAEAVKAFL
jgi:DNA-binding transcriptional MocR family regulator